MNKTVSAVIAAMLLIAASVTASAQVLSNYYLDGKYQARSFKNYRFFSQNTTTATSTVMTVAPTANEQSNASYACTNLQVTGADGYQGLTFLPLQVGTRLFIQDANSEVVTVTAVSNTAGACSFTATFANAHNPGAIVLSATGGLDEAINYAQNSGFAKSGGSAIVQVDGSWTNLPVGTKLVAISGAPNYSGVGIMDTSGVEPVVYRIGVSTSTALPTPTAAPTLTGSAGGSLTSSGTYYMAAQYVDMLGGQSLPGPDSAQITLSSQQTITATSPAATTGAVGWIPMITASAGGTGTEIAVPVTSSICTLTTLESVIPACAIGSSAVVTANPSGTAKENVVAWGHTTFTYQPVSTPIWTSGPDFQTTFGAFAAGATVNSSNEDIAEFYVPPGYFNYYGKSWDLCTKVITATNVAGSVATYKLYGTNNYAQSAVLLGVILFPTQTSATNGTTVDLCFNLTTTTSGASGVFTPVGVGTSVINTSATVGGVASIGGSTIFAAPSAIDMTKGIYFSLNITETIGDNITAPQVMSLSLKPIPGS